MGFKIDVDEFSGPLDLLCKLIESGEMEASRIRVADLVRTYSSYLLVEKAVPIGTISEFIALTARLLLGKVRGLFPTMSLDAEENLVPASENADEALREALERYRPFRKAAEILGSRMYERQQFCLRQTEEGPPIYDYGDLYSLARLWWDLLYSKGKISPEAARIPSEEMLGFESPEPDFLQVERRMRELEILLNQNRFLCFKSVAPLSSNRSTIVVTLLALLEMARLGQLKIIQEERFGEIRFEGS